MILIPDLYIVSYLPKNYDIHSFLESFGNLEGGKNLIQYEFIEQDLKMDLPYIGFFTKRTWPLVSVELSIRYRSQIAGNPNFDQFKPMVDFLFGGNSKDIISEYSNPYSDPTIDESLDKRSKLFYEFERSYLGRPRSKYGILWNADESVAVMEQLDDLAHQCENIDEFANACFKVKLISKQLKKRMCSPGKLECFFKGLKPSWWQ